MNVCLRDKLLALSVALLVQALLFGRICIAKDVYLAVRHDGRTGSGSAEDPFDASSAAKYDKILARFRSSTNFYYAAGVYETTGGHRTQPTANPNCHHYGAGIDKTIIRLVDAFYPAAAGVIFFADYDATVDGFQLANLTLDCNASGNPTFRDGLGALGAVNVVGSNILLSHLKIEHFGTAKAGVECFPVFCCAMAGHSGAHLQNIRLENCVFTEPAIGNKDGLTCAGIGGAADVQVEGTIANCRFIDLASDFTYSHAFGAAVCEGNDVEGCSEGFYLEPNHAEEGTFIVRNNRFRDVENAVLICWHPEGSLKTIVFENNDVVLGRASRRSANAFAIDDAGLKPGDKRPIISKIIFRDNQVRFAESPSRSPMQAFGLNLVSRESKYLVGELVVERNHFKLPPGLEMVVSRSSGLVGNCLERANVDDRNVEVYIHDWAGTPGTSPQNLKNLNNEDSSSAHALHSP